MAIANDAHVIYVRPYQPADRPQVFALHGRVWAEWHRGAEPESTPAVLERIEDCYLAFWVAIQPRGNAEDVVGMVGAEPPGPDIPPRLTAGRSKVVQLSRLRIAAECRRQGVGARLCHALIDWAYDREAVLTNTIPANDAARALFHKLGFAEVGTTSGGTNELTWFELPVSGEQDPDGHPRPIQRG